MSTLVDHQKIRILVSVHAKLQWTQAVTLLLLLGLPPAIIEGGSENLTQMYGSLTSTVRKFFHHLLVIT